MRSDPTTKLHDLMPDVLDDEFVLIADKWNSATVREHVAAAIARASLTPVYDIAIRTTQVEGLATAGGPESDWDQGCRIVVLRNPRAQGALA